MANDKKPIYFSDKQLVLIQDAFDVIQCGYSLNNEQIKNKEIIENKIKSEQKYRKGDYFKRH